MRYTDLLANAEDLKPGMLASMTFAPNCPTDVLRLRPLIGRKPMILIEDPMADAVIYAVGTTGNWGGDYNRTFLFKVLEGFSAEIFTDQLWKGLESIEILSPE